MKAQLHVTDPTEASGRLAVPMGIIQRYANCSKMPILSPLSRSERHKPTKGPIIRGWDNMV
jgi:hypothetical protein